MAALPTDLFSPFRLPVGLKIVRPKKIIAINISLYLNFLEESHLTDYAKFYMKTFVCLNINNIK